MALCSLLSPDAFASVDALSSTWVQVWPGGRPPLPSSPGAFEDTVRKLRQASVAREVFTGPAGDVLQAPRAVVAAIALSPTSQRLPILPFNDLPLRSEYRSEHPVPVNGP
jgi:hypothetical protein